MNNQQARAAEANAFNQRIAERKNAGFVPDLRRAVKCDYFYKSFWRDPHFIQLYLGENVRVFLELIEKFGRPASRVLDVGCGAGYISLELARAGHHVRGIDIAEQAIQTACEVLASNPYQEGFGSLEYRVSALDEEASQYDLVLFSGVIHHFASPEAVIDKALKVLAPQGLLLCFEPCHERWRRADAAQVALIRVLLSLTGCWYEPDLAATLKNQDALAAYAEAIQREYVTEQDRNERGQSPNDNASSGERILASLRRKTVELAYRPGVSFIYRLLGGLRGPDERIYPLADFLALFDRFSVESGYLQPNSFFYLGRKP